MDESYPTQQDIAQWKAAYGSIYSANLAGQDFIFRTLSLAEYNVFYERSETTDSASQDEFVVDTVLLYPQNPDFDNKPAGIVTALAEEVIGYSGFGTPKKGIVLLNEAREGLNDVRGLMKAFILAAMPAYREEELNQFNFKQLVSKVALSEKILEIQHSDDLPRLDLIDPEEEAKRQAAEKKKAAATRKPGQALPDDEIARRLHAAMAG